MPAEIGDDRNRFADARGLKAGASPRTGWRVAPPSGFSSSFSPADDVTRNPNIMRENHQNHVMSVHQAAREAECGRSSRTGMGAGNDAQLNSRQRSTRKMAGAIRELPNPHEIHDAAIAMLDADGTVVGWTDTAQRLVGYSAGEVVGRSASVVLQLAKNASRVQAFAEQCRARGGWSGNAAVRHRDGHTLNVGLRISQLWGQDGAVHWLVSGTDIAALSFASSSGSVRESILTRTPIGIIVRDRELRCTWVNDAIERQQGIPRDRRLGRRLTDVLPGLEAEALEVVMRQVLDSGRTAVHEYRAWPPAEKHREHVFAASYFCLRDADGQTLGVCCINLDVTGSRRARERLAILSEAGTRIGNSLDVMQTSQELADLAVPLLADYATVDLADSVPLGEEELARTSPAGGRRPVLRRAGVASIHPGIPESPWARGESVFLPPHAPQISVLSSGRSHLEPVLDTAAGTWLDRDPARARTIHEHGIHSLMIVPIRTRRAMLGLAVFIRTEEPTPFQEDDLLLAEELVTRAALALDNARRYAREHSVALTLQRTLLPHRLGDSAAVEVASRYLPADRHHGVGGDWFDVIPLSGARVALVVGDVVGHGINAAATMGSLRTVVRTLAAMDLTPNELLTRLDDTVRRLTEEDEDADDHDQFAVAGATCLYAVYDPVTRRCTMARAGHPPPAVIDLHGKVTFPALPAGNPLGVGLGIPFEAVELDLPEGTQLALYTDGLVESRDHDLDVGMKRLGAALAHPGWSLEDLCTSVIETLPTQSPSDDVTLLLARTRSLSPSQTATWDLPSDPAVVRTARALVTGELTRWGLDGMVPSTELIVSELVTNAVRHASGPIRLRLIRHEALTCEVSDASDHPPRRHQARSFDESGHGLSIVAQLCRRQGCRRATGGGKTVWAEQELPKDAGKSTGCPGKRFP
ncbi:SpoIIE family protein phosphatase [Streptomyces sp. 3212.3]|uniref:SpoIIE family protein phosphatase n=1 Tax=Streptomyces sp. 3212.3 TaxID=1938846 RepID=UPI003A7F4CDB